MLLISSSPAATGLSGFPQAIETVYPRTQVQLCIVHMVRNSLTYVSWKDRKQVAKDLRVIYQAATLEQAEAALDRFAEHWDKQYPHDQPAVAQTLGPSDHCFVAARTTKHLSFSSMPTDFVYSDALYIFTSDRWDLFTVVQSTLHEVWARKYSGTLKQDLRYSPSNCFDTFAVPAGLWQTTDPGLAEFGERYHAHRKELMQCLWLGLTKVYNLFHTRDLSPETVAKVSKKDLHIAVTGFETLLELRRLHVALDIAVRDAYGWQDLDLEHDFYEVEILPENDRVRYTISPTARREVLKRLLAENHTRTGAEAKNLNTSPTRGGRERIAATGPGLFGGGS